MVCSRSLEEKRSEIVTENSKGRVTRCKEGSIIYLKIELWLSKLKKLPVLTNLIHKMQENKDPVLGQIISHQLLSDRLLVKI